MNAQDHAQASEPTTASARALVLARRASLPCLALSLSLGGSGSFGVGLRAGA